MAYKITIADPDVTTLTIDADEHSIEPAINTVGSSSPEVYRFWNKTGDKRDLVAVIPFHTVLILQRA